MPSESVRASSDGQYYLFNVAIYRCLGELKLTNREKRMGKMRIKAYKQLTINRLQCPTAPYPLRVKGAWVR